jgi:hypothetical protein
MRAAAMKQNGVDRVEVAISVVRWIARRLGDGAAPVDLASA